MSNVIYYFLNHFIFTAELHPSQSCYHQFSSLLKTETLLPIFSFKNITGNHSLNTINHEYFLMRLRKLYTDKNSISYPNKLKILEILSLANSTFMFLQSETWGTSVFTVTWFDYSFLNIKARKYNFDCHDIAMRLHCTIKMDIWIEM